ncbi:MAG: hypothetical protein ACPGVL_00370 [Pseudoalteromonas spongiae]|uniref:hypothetical protein n=1 Tax=Pseudoalteromonas TaxID=53246 RepID=UPI00026C9136|nr:MULTISPECIES: hypothetical protein [Pseudoalteromonas]ATC99930.1 hypothetical protein PSPO_a3077 [Pseudoalteromonas spongiae UST010723-006]KPV98069.1 hypothetical protein AN214_00455 [Pseudoalteromonas sp. P1-9]MCF6456385.1 hypothetical protein [Pseudoalteromonas sp. MMG024]MEC8328053.1 hypothetical protein [Pseudomonadota bacterium]
MSALTNKPTAERRQGEGDLNAFWSNLSFAQKVELNKLNRYGYQLAFARKLEENYLAFARCDTSYATIDYLGEVDMEPHFRIR